MYMCKRCTSVLFVGRQTATAHCKVFTVRSHTAFHARQGMRMPVVAQIGQVDAELLVRRGVLCLNAATLYFAWRLCQALSLVAAACADVFAVCRCRRARTRARRGRGMMAAAMRSVSAHRSVRHMTKWHTAAMQDAARFCSSHGVRHSSSVSGPVTRGVPCV